MIYLDYQATTPVAPEVAEAMRPWAEEWFAKAKEHPGSWWTDWAAWLEGHAGKQIAAPKSPGNRKYKTIEPAPGRYVKEKAT